MNFHVIGILIRLRYKLLWAKTRTRNGKIALFFAGYLFLIMFAMLFALGGLGAGMAAVRSGKGTNLASAILGGIFVQAMLASVILGFGMSTVFSELELRRYPLNTGERQFTRQFIGLADPFWFLFFVLDVSIALGLYLLGAGSFWLGLFAVLLLFVCNYAAARVLGAVVDRLMSKRGGPVVMLVFVISIGMLPSVLQQYIHKDSSIVVALTQLWRGTPPAGAALAMTHADTSGLLGLGIIVLWTAALLAVLVALERAPVKIRAVHAGALKWDSPFDRIGALYGPVYGPLVSHWLRFYSRNNRFRAIYPLALPLVGFIIYFWGRRPHMVGGLFPAAISGFSILGCVGTFQFAVNQFGYVEGGFRRFQLLPTAPAAAFRAGNLMFVTLSALLIPLGTLGWILFGPKPLEIRGLVMLVGASFTGLFLFHGLALWTSLYGPRRGNYKMAMGNDLSAAGNVVVIGGMLISMFLPGVLSASAPRLVTPEFWWFTPLLAAAAFGFYLVSLERTTALFRSKREALMVLMEGKA